MSFVNNISPGLLALPAAVTTANAPALAQQPNILAIMGDDIGFWNISAYDRGGWKSVVERMKDQRAPRHIVGARFSAQQ